MLYIFLMFYKYIIKCFYTGDIQIMGGGIQIIIILKQ